MAFTEEQKHKIVRILGWSGKVLLPDTIQYNSRVARSFDNMNEYIEAEAVVILERIEMLDETREQALSRALVKSIGDIQLNDRELDILRGERSRLVRELSDLLDIAFVGRGGAMVNVAY